MKSTPNSAEIAQVQRRLSELRRALLALHKALVDSERISYEAAAGPIQSPSHFLQLLTDDAWFAWLRPFSQLIVATDLAMDEKEPLTMSTVDVLARQARLLLVGSEEGEGFSGHYYLALQRDPDVVMAHADVAKLLGPRPADPVDPRQAPPAD